MAAGLKLKEFKCDFFKKEIHYLGHLISDKRIHPLPGKLDSIHTMSKLKKPQGNKGVMQLVQEVCTLFFQIILDPWWSWQHMMQNLFGVDNVICHYDQLQSRNIRILLNPTLFSQMLASMVGQVSSPSNTLLWLMGRRWQSSCILC